MNELQCGQTLHPDSPQVQRGSYEVVSDVITARRKKMWLCVCANHRFFPIEYRNLKPAVRATEPHCWQNAIVMKFCGWWVRFSSASCESCACQVLSVTHNHTAAGFYFNITGFEILPSG